MELSVRAMKQEIRDLLIKRIHELADFTAKSYGASSVVEVYDSYPVLTNSPEETDFARRWRWRCLAAKGSWSRSRR